MSDRYSILGPIAKGGMAQVYLGRMVASAGFSRLVAIKRLHESLGTDREFVAMLLDEARLTAQIRHTNVVDILDLVVRDGAFALVLEYVEGDSLSALVKGARAEGEKVPRPVVLAIMQGVLRGLIAAHEARGDDGEPLGIVHRDVSPQNVLVGVDGIPRIIDFGVAKAFGKLEATRPGEVRGKYGYMAPEQLMGRPVTRQIDVYAAGVLLWELLTNERLFFGEDERVVCAAVLRGEIPKPSTKVADIPPELDAVVMRAVARETNERYLDARELLAAIEPFGRASEDEVGMWVRGLASQTLIARQRLVQQGAAPTDARSIDELLQELSRPSGAISLRGSRNSFPDVPVSPPSSPSVAASSSSVGHLPLKKSPAPWIFAIGGGVAFLIFVLVLGLLATRPFSKPDLASGLEPLPPPPPVPAATTSSTASAAVEVSSSAPTSMPRPSSTAPAAVSSPPRAVRKAGPAKPASKPGHPPIDPNSFP